MVGFIAFQKIIYMSIFVWASIISFIFTSSLFKIIYNKGYSLIVLLVCIVE